MTVQLSKGQNGPLTVTEVVVSVELSAPADLSALLVTESGKVRSDADFVFFNQPTGPGVRLIAGVDGRPARLVVTLTAVPTDISRVRAIITLDNPSSTFGASAAPIARVADATGQALFEYRIDGMTTESIVIAVELYRRGGDWKLRAVGQGYDGGFAALVEDHGVRVDDPPPAPPPRSGPSTPPQSAAPVRSRHPDTAPSEVSLVKGRTVNLTKGQRVSLRKDGGVALTQVRMGLGWDPLQRRGLFGNRTPDIDLDASAILFADDQLVDVAYYGQLATRDGSIRHQGDNLTGEGDGDDEVINVDLTRIPAHVNTVMFIVTSYRGHTFDQLSNAFCRLVDALTNAELARYTLSGNEMRCTGMVMAKFFRHGPDWKLQALGDGMQAKHPGEAAPQLIRFL